MNEQVLDHCARVRGGPEILVSPPDHSGFCGSGPAIGYAVVLVNVQTSIGFK